MLRGNQVVSATNILAGTILTMTIASMQIGCNSKDERFAELAERTVVEQSRQNQHLAQQSSKLTEAAQQLVKQDALSRREMMDRHANLQEIIQRQQTNIDQRRDALDRDRKTFAKQRQRDPVVAQSISAIGLSIACLIPLALAAYVLYTANLSDGNEKQFNEILIHELTGELPRLLPELGTMLSTTTPVETLPNLEDRRQHDGHSADHNERENESQENDEDENQFVF